MEDIIRNNVNTYALFNVASMIHSKKLNPKNFDQLLAHFKNITFTLNEEKDKKRAKPETMVQSFDAETSSKDAMQCITKYFIQINSENLDEQNEAKTSEIIFTSDIDEILYLLFLLKYNPNSQIQLTMARIEDLVKNSKNLKEYFVICRIFECVYLNLILLKHSNEDTDRLLYFVAKTEIELEYLASRVPSMTLTNQCEIFLKTPFKFVKIFSEKFFLVCTSLYKKTRDAKYIALQLRSCSFLCIDRVRKNWYILEWLVLTARKFHYIEFICVYKSLELDLLSPQAKIDLEEFHNILTMNVRIDPFRWEDYIFGYINRLREDQKSKNKYKKYPERKYVKLICKGKDKKGNDVLCNYLLDVGFRFFRNKAIEEKMASN